MSRRSIFTYLFFVLCLCSCAPQTVSSPAYALTLTQKYMQLYETYKSHYKAVGTEQRVYMRKNIAPLLDSAKTVLHEYNKSVIAGEQDLAKKTQLIELLRRASMRLTGVDDDIE